MYASLGTDLVPARRARFMAEAQSARVAQSARRHGRSVSRAAKSVDPAVCVRVLEPADIDHLRGLSERLSRRSLRLRYLAPLRAVSERALRRLAEIDHERHEALGAFDDGLLVAAAHYVRDLTDPSRAEISVEVADSHQRRGIGPRLVNELALLARSRGVVSFEATALLENTGVLAMLRDSEWQSLVSTVGPELEIAVTLPDPPGQRALVGCPGS